MHAYTTNVLMKPKRVLCVCNMPIKLYARARSVTLSLWFHFSLEESFDTGIAIHILKGERFKQFQLFELIATN